VDFDAYDGDPVDLIIGMMVPIELDESHYADIDLMTRILADEGLRSRLRGATSSKELYSALISGSEALLPETAQEPRES
jgi:PTS system nitrogen regulatory IIA component